MAYRNLTPDFRPGTVDQHAAPAEDATDELLVRDHLHVFAAVLEHCPVDTGYGKKVSMVFNHSVILWGWRIIYPRNRWSLLSFAADQKAMVSEVMRPG